jgi:hypothetical protein
MGFADTVAEHKSGPKTVISGQLSKWLIGRPKRESKNYNISSIFGECPRQTMLEALIQKPSDWNAQATRRADAGSAMHWWYQNKYFGPMGVLMGIWECTACGARTEKGSLMPFVPCGCGGPNSKRWEFVETRVEYEIPGLPGVLLTGYYDGGIQSDHGKFLVDMKFPGPKTFSKLSSPPEGYVNQVELYMAIEGWDGEGLLFYGDKNDGTEAVEFIVHRNESALPEAVEKIKAIEVVKSDLRKWAEERCALVIPDRICADEKIGRFSRWCPWGQECFNDVRMKDLMGRVPA